MMYTLCGSSPYLQGDLNSVVETETGERDAETAFISANGESGNDKISFFHVVC